MLCFAYGSNLDDEQMRSRCASARAVARAVLPNYALAFGGFSQRWDGAVARVVPARGSRVEGLIYRVEDTEMCLLDRFEGHPFAYERVVKRVLDEHGCRRRAAMYLQAKGTFQPWTLPPEYVRVLWRAYARLGFDIAPLAAAVGVERSN